MGFNGHLIHSCWRMILEGITYQVSNIMYQVSNIKYHVSSTKYQVSSIKYQDIQNTVYQVSRNSEHRLNPSGAASSITIALHLNSMQVLHATCMGSNAQFFEINSLADVDAHWHGASCLTSMSSNTLHPNSMHASLQPVWAQCSSVHVSTSCINTHPCV